eukprot:TRINITY_DN9721_c0_g1_i2.p1 TRINITY_DN9721_c0_g1~~TRINITY_DN9721_c0_g1_i2.p1  ORF type:complete len:793 (+),score=119.51 TRINITY_DN9721_c0_g1_i2:280-2658(+)
MLFQQSPCYIHRNRGVRLISAEKYSQAIKEFKAALRLDNQLYYVWHQIGILYMQTSDFLEAIASFNRAKDIIETHKDLDYDVASVYFDLADVYQKRGFHETARYYYKIGFSKLDDKNPSIKRLGDIAGYLISSSGASTEEIPGSLSIPEVCYTTAYDESINYLERLLLVEPTNIYTLNQIAKTYIMCNKISKAVHILRQATQSAPRNHVLWYNLGTALMKDSTSDAAQRAIEAFHAALEIAPSLAEAEFNLASLYERLKNHKMAIIHGEKAANLSRRSSYIGTLLSAKIKVCDWRGFDELQNHLIEMVDEESRGSTNSQAPAIQPFEALLVPGFDANLVTSITKKFADMINSAVAAGRRFNVEIKQRTPIRVGYFSSKFGDSQLGHLLYDFFRHHDKNLVQASCVSISPDIHSNYASHFRSSCPSFVDLGDFKGSDFELASRIQSLDFDIIIDLNGWTKGHRYGALALRPAPIQINWLEYPSTSAADFMDYIILDPVIAPPGSEEDLAVTEKIIRFPETYQVNSHAFLYADVPSAYVCDDARKYGSEPCPKRKDFGLPESGVVFCNFNQLYKIDRDLFQSWIRIAKETPDSTLWLLRFPSDGEEYLRHEWSRSGLSDQRLVFGDLIDRSAHMRRLSLCSLVLDNWTYNSHGTATDALWVGVPIITRFGHKIASRVAASLLTAVSLDHLITHTNHEYEDLAIKLAYSDLAGSDFSVVEISPDRLTSWDHVSHNNDCQSVYRDRVTLGSLRCKLHYARQTSPLFDTARQVRNLQTMYAAVVKQTRDARGSGLQD